MQRPLPSPLIYTRKDMIPCPFVYACNDMIPCPFVYACNDMMLMHSLRNMLLFLNNLGNCIWRKGAYSGGRGGLSSVRKDKGRKDVRFHYCTYDDALRARPQTKNMHTYACIHPRYWSAYS